MVSELNMVLCCFTILFKAKKLSYSTIFLMLIVRMASRWAGWLLDRFVYQEIFRK